MASFADYVKDLMASLPQVNGNPMLSVTSMTDDNARYREDPFYRSREIQARDQLVLEEEERRRLEAALSEPGMLPTYGSDSSAPIGLTQQQESMLARESLEDQGARIKNDFFGLKPIASIMMPGGLFNAAKTAYNNYQANQMAVDPGIQAAVQAQEAAARSAYNSRFAPTDSGSSGGGGHDAGITGGNSFGGSNADGGGYNE